jgi:hypothetical protein
MLSSVLLKQGHNNDSSGSSGGDPSLLMNNNSSNRKINQEEEREPLNVDNNYHPPAPHVVQGFAQLIALGLIACAVLIICFFSFIKGGVL